MATQSAGLKGQKFLNAIDEIVELNARDRRVTEIANRLGISGKAVFRALNEINAEFDCDNLAAMNAQET